MEIINHECYVSLEVAGLLEKAGFNWQDYFVAHSIDEHFHWEIPLHIAQKWLRDVKKYYIVITLRENKHSVTNSDGWTFHYEYYDPIFDYEINNEKGETIYTVDDTYKTYEQAQEAAIKKALEMI